MNSSSIKVFKFGGASIKDAAGFKGVAGILKNYSSQELVLIVSALGKTTNALEEIVSAYFTNKKKAVQLLHRLQEAHLKIIGELFTDIADPIFHEVNNAFVEIEWVLEEDRKEEYDYVYDQIVSIGEMASTKMLAAYLNDQKIPVRWLDVRDYIKTDNTYREGKIDWVTTGNNISTKIPSVLKNQFVLTQGFLGGTSENYTTTLGREGSDYSASVFAYCLNAESVTIWKDVAGVLNADPRFFSESIKIDALSYYEAIEMSYYGATVIHPKTIKPLQNKQIPLYVKCFLSPKDSGTLISDRQEGETLPPVLVLKKNQLLISIYPKDFSFIAEDNLSHIFLLLHQYRVKVNLLQLSALSFSVCADQLQKTEPLMEELSRSFIVLRNENLQLLTIRHYNEELISQHTNEKEILLEQRSRQTIQLVLR